MDNRIKRNLAKYFLFRVNDGAAKSDLPIAVFNDRIGKFVMVEGYYEKKFVDTVLNSLAFDPGNHTCLDIGANMGNYTLLFKKVFEQVYSFEPQRRTFKLLSLNTAHLDDVYLFNYGLSNVDSEPVFKISKAEVVSGAPNWDSEVVDEEKVELKVYDSHFDQEVAFVRIDAAGSEREAIEGMKRTLMKYKPVIAFDHDPEKQDTQALAELLETMGYTEFWIPKEHFIERYIPAKEGLMYYLKLLIRLLTPSAKQELAHIDLRSVHKKYSFLTTFHPESRFKLS